MLTHLQQWGSASFPIQKVLWILFKSLPKHIRDTRGPGASLTLRQTQNLCKENSLIFCLWFSSCIAFSLITLSNLQDNLKHFGFGMNQITEKQSNHHSGLFIFHWKENRCQYHAIVQQDDYVLNLKECAKESSLCCQRKSCQKSAVQVVETWKFNNNSLLIAIKIPVSVIFFFYSVLLIYVRD